MSRGKIALVKLGVYYVDFRARRVSGQVGEAHYLQSNLLK